jgi:hypothetical protein
VPFSKDIIFRGVGERGSFIGGTASCTPDGVFFSSCDLLTNRVNERIYRLQKSWYMHVQPEVATSDEFDCLDGLSVQYGRNQPRLEIRTLHFNLVVIGTLGRSE